MCLSFRSRRWVHRRMGLARLLPPPMFLSKPGVSSKRLDLVAKAVILSAKLLVVFAKFRSHAKLLVLHLLELVELFLVLLVLLVLHVREVCDFPFFLLDDLLEVSDLVVVGLAAVVTWLVLDVNTGGCRLESIG